MNFDFSDTYLVAIRIMCIALLVGPLYTVA